MKYSVRSVEFYSPHWRHPRYRDAFSNTPWWMRRLFCPTRTRISVFRRSEHYVEHDNNWYWDATNERNDYSGKAPCLRRKPKHTVSVEEVVKIASLARIAIAPADHARIAGELSVIMSWITQLNEVDTAGVEPMTSVASAVQQRADVVTDGDRRDEILANAPETERGFFVVPKVVE